MMRSIGVVIILWYLSITFTGTFTALDRALSQSLGTLEMAAVISRDRLVE
jgi:hypothetical protein